MIKVGTLCIPVQVCLLSRSSLALTHECCLLRDTRRAAFLPFVHAETESQARASMGKPLGFYLRHASQVQQMLSSHYLNPGNYRAFSLIQGSSITLAHSDEPCIYICRIRGNSWKLRFHELPVEREFKIRVLKTHSHTSQRQDTRKKERKGGLL